MTAILERLKHRKLRTDFRYDIAGLRAIAVLMVVLYGFKIPGFSGGFIGPDIFFVLSGYLITGILYREFSESKEDLFKPGRISMSNFYLKRLRRIIPVAFFVILAINVYSFINLDTDQASQIRTDSLWTLFFVANVNFMHQAVDFFGSTSNASPFQHYWSLAIEEQFYLIWPMFFLFAGNMRRLIAMNNDPALWKRRILLFFAIATVGSALWLVVEFSSSPKSAFFSTFGRIWEIALGSMLSLIDFQAAKKRIAGMLPALRLLALAGIFISLFIVTPANFGYMLFIPAVSTGFLLVSGAGQSTPDFVSRFLSLRVFTALGAISYSLYLWHWPVAVFATQVGHLDTVAQRLLGVVVALVLGTASYWLIEKPVMKIPVPKLERLKMRTAMRPHVQQSAWRTGAIAFTFASILLFLHYPPVSATDEVWNPPTSATDFAPNAIGTSEPNNGSTVSQKDYALAWRRLVSESVKVKALPTGVFPKVADLVQSQKVTNAKKCPGQREDTVTLSLLCEQRASVAAESRSAVIIGDGISRNMWSTINSALDAKHWNVTLLAKSGCSIQKVSNGTLSPLSKKCVLRSEAVLKYIEQVKPDLTILVERNDSAKSLKDLQVSYLPVMSRLTSASKNVLVVTSPPTFPNLNTCLKSKAEFANCKPISQNNLNSRTVIYQLADRYGSSVLDLTEVLCSPKAQTFLCPAVIGTDVTTFDGVELTPRMLEKITPFLLQTLSDAGIEDLATN